jgi:hypothetical protein
MVSVSTSKLVNEANKKFTKTISAYTESSEKKCLDLQKISISWHCPFKNLGGKITTFAKR